MTNELRGALAHDDQGRVIEGVPPVDIHPRRDELLAGPQVTPPARLDKLVELGTQI